MLTDHEQPKVFYVLDFDRTLVDTDKLDNILINVLERETTIEVGKLLQKARAINEDAGVSFETINYLRHMLASGLYGENAWQRMQRAFIADAQREDTLESGAKDLLHLLESNNLPHGIITFGNEAWQLAKLEASGLIRMPHLVTRIKEKGRLLAGWKHDSGSFIIPPAMTRDFKPLTVDSIVFLDDKAVSFQDIPEGVKGVCVRSPSGKVLPSQMGSIPANVASVKGLPGAIELLFSTPHRRHKS